MWPSKYQQSPSSLTCHESIVEIGLHTINKLFSPFCDFTRLPLKSPFSTLSLEYIDEIQRYSELFHRYNFCHYVCWIFLCTNLHQVNNFFYYHLMTYPMILHINVLCSLVILMIFSEMNCILTVAVDLNWILYDAKCTDQSSQPQDFLRCLNCSHVIHLCCWKCHSILQLCLPTNNVLSYYEYITHRKFSLIKISCIICINISL